MSERVYYSTLPGGLLRSYAVVSAESLRANCDEVGDCLIWRGHIGSGQTPLVHIHGEGMKPVRRILSDLLGLSGKRGRYYAAGCGDPLCVAPEHIVRRTQAQQGRAMSAALAASSSSELLRRRKISESKRRLTADQVADILQSPDDGAILADRLGISRSTVSKYRLGKLGAYRATNPWAALALGGARA